MNQHALSSPGCWEQLGMTGISGDIFFKVSAWKARRAVFSMN